MSDEDKAIELVAKTTGEVVAALTEQSGALAVPNEYANFIAARIHLRHYPRLIESAMKAAKKIEETGLPRRAFSAIDEPLLTAILEGTAEETDPNLQEAWENLLANGLTEGSAEVRRAFPKVLSELDPIEAHILDAMADGKGTFLGALSGTRMAHGPVKSLPLNGLPNLERLDLIGIRQNMIAPTRYPAQTTPDADRMRVIGLTPFGVGFVEACRPPKTTGTDAKTSNDEGRETDQSAAVAT